jgi:hypothetical protein
MSLFLQTSVQHDGIVEDFYDEVLGAHAFGRVLAHDGTHNWFSFG